jgi:hypothetical protein
MKRISCALILGCSLLAPLTAHHASAATVTLAALSSWGGGDGWLAPGEGGYAYLGTGNNERGLAYGNGHVYLVSRANVGGNASNVRILNANTAADLGGLNSAGIAGGAFTVNTAAVGGDGVIYVNNLANPTSATTNFKVYGWSTEAAVPSAVYDGDGGLLGARVGDSLAAIGSGAGTRLVAGYGSAPAIAGNNGYAIIDPTSGTATRPAFAGTPPNAGDFRLGLTFVDASHVIGAQGSSLYRYTSFSGSTGTLIASPTIPDPVGATADRLLAYTVLNGTALLAVQSIGDSHVSIYDVTNPASPVHLVSGNNTSGVLTTNGNGTGQMAWGAVTNNGGGSMTQALYTMSTNQGIQAFNITVAVPEPASLASLIAGAMGLSVVRRRRQVA